VEHLLILNVPFHGPVRQSPPVTLLCDSSCYDPVQNKGNHPAKVGTIYQIRARDAHTEDKIMTDMTGQ
jgi:hypothetical protein